jgi:hypothetical protein
MDGSIPAHDENKFGPILNCSTCRMLGIVWFGRDEHGWHTLQPDFDGVENAFLPLARLSAR